MNRIIRHLGMVTAFTVLTSMSAQLASAQDFTIHVHFSVDGQGQSFDPLGTSTTRRMEAREAALDDARAQVARLASSYAGPGISVKVVETSISYDTRWVKQTARWYSTCTIDGYLVITGPPWIIDFLPIARI